MDSVHSLAIAGAALAGSAADRGERRALLAMLRCSLPPWARRRSTRPSTPNCATTRRRTSRRSASRTLTPRVLVVAPQVAAKNIAELIALAKSRPDGLTYGSAGNGSSSHLAGALFESKAGVKMLHVPYKGSAPLLTDLLAGRVDMTFDSYTVYVEHIKSGRVRALGVTSVQRLQALPLVPTIAEAGVKGYEVSNWLGLLAPAGTPKDALEKIHAALGRTMATPALREQLTALGIEPTFGSTEAFSALIRSEIPKWSDIVRKSGATAE